MNVWRATLIVAGAMLLSSPTWARGGGLWAVKQASSQLTSSSQYLVHAVRSEVRHNHGFVPGGGHHGYGRHSIIARLANQAQQLSYAASRLNRTASWARGGYGDRYTNAQIKRQFRQVKWLYEQLCQTYLSYQYMFSHRTQYAIDNVTHAFRRLQRSVARLGYGGGRPGGGGGIGPRPWNVIH